MPTISATDQHDQTTNTYATSMEEAHKRAEDAGNKWLNSLQMLIPKKTFDSIKVINWKLVEKTMREVFPKHLESVTQRYLEERARLFHEINILQQKTKKTPANKVIVELCGQREEFFRRIYTKYMSFHERHKTPKKDANETKSTKKRLVAAIANFKELYQKTAIFSFPFSIIMGQEYHTGDKLKYIADLMKEITELHSKQKLIVIMLPDTLQRFNFLDPSKKVEGTDLYPSEMYLIEETAAQLPLAYLYQQLYQQNFAEPLINPRIHAIESYPAPNAEDNPVVFSQNCISDGKNIDKEDLQTYLPKIKSTVSIEKIATLETVRLRFKDQDEEETEEDTLIQQKKNKESNSSAPKKDLIAERREKAMAADIHNLSAEMAVIKNSLNFMLQYISELTKTVNTLAQENIWLKHQNQQFLKEMEIDSTRSQQEAPDSISPPNSSPIITAPTSNPNNQKKNKAQNQKTSNQMSWDNLSEKANKELEELKRQKAIAASNITPMQMFGLFPPVYPNLSSPNSSAHTANFPPAPNLSPAEFK